MNAADHGTVSSCTPRLMQQSIGDVMLEVRKCLAVVRRREGDLGCLASTFTRVKSAPSSAQRRRQDLDAQRDQRVLSSAGRHDHLPRRRPARGCSPMRRPARALRAPSRTWRCSRACRRSTTSCRAHAEDEEELLLADAAVRPGANEEIEHRHKVEEIIDFLEIQHIRKTPVGQAALRPAEARRAGPRAGDGAGPAAARRADGGHEPRGKGGHEPLHLDVNEPDRHHHRADRARHGRGDGPVRPGGGARLRRKIADGTPDEVKTTRT
jgi:hypothetical protein